MFLEASRLMFTFPSDEVYVCFTLLGKGSCLFTFRMKGNCVFTSLKAIKLRVNIFEKSELVFTFIEREQGA